MDAKVVHGWRTKCQRDPGDGPGDTADNYWRPCVQGCDFQMHIDVRIVGERVTQEGAAEAAFGSAARGMGMWAAWRWDGTELRAEVDRYGFYPLFYCPLGDGIAVSDSIAELLRLGASREFNDGGIAAFLRLGFFLGEDTAFAAISAFPPGGRLTWQREAGLRVEGRTIPRKPDSSSGRAQAVGGYVELFRSAMARVLPDDPAVTALPLSGGRDSRHIALELKRLGFQPGLVISQRHFASRSDEDAEVASALSAALDWPITIVPQSRDPVGAELEKNRRFDCVTDEHSWFVPCAQRIVAAGVRYVFDGIAGDALSGGLFVRKPWIELGRSGRLDRVLDVVPGSGYGASETALGCLLASPYLRRWGRDAAQGRVAREISQYRVDDNPLNQFFFWNRTRREIAPFMIRYLPGVEVLTPYLDAEVFDFLWNLPTALLEDHRLHDEAIARAAPEYAQIPFEGGSRPHDPDTHTACLMRGMARRLMFWWGDGILNRTWLRPRLTAAALSRARARGAGWYVPWAIWLACLERLAGESPERG